MYYVYTFMSSSDPGLLYFASLSDLAQARQNVGQSAVNKNYDILELLLNATFHKLIPVLYGTMVSGWEEDTFIGTDTEWLCEVA